MNNFLLHETKIHGTPDFPYIVYHGQIPEYIESFPCHWHDEMELVYIVSGQLKITVWSHSYHVYPGDIVIILPHAIHSIERFGNESGEYFNIVFHFSILGSDTCYDKYARPFMTHEKTVNCYERSGSGLNTSLTPLVRSLIENRRNSYTTHEYLVKANLFMLIHLLNQHCMDANENELALHLTSDKLKAALYHIHNSYDRDIPVQKAAALCGFSESHFMKLFKELTGMSFTAYLIRHRLELSASQLAETNLSVSEIAANCGFHNDSYFTRAFTKKYGITPTRYRKTHRSVE